jgi:23S rRNA pseudouridine2604 synthase
MAKKMKKLFDNQQTDNGIRINKYLSDAGVCSRREADRYIAQGRVTINGTTAVMGSKVMAGDTVMLDSKPVEIDESFVLIAFNKPRGIVCTTDKREKDNIVDYIKYNKRIYPVGRLDKDSEGLILLTNDGSIVNKILKASNYHEKEYVVTVNKPITNEFLKGMASGVPILDTVTRPCTIKAIDRYTFRIILTQGLNRQIRRMCEYFGYKVIALKRIRIMNIQLGHLKVGEYRNVTAKELNRLYELIQNSKNVPAVLFNSSKKANSGIKQ